MSMDASRASTESFTRLEKKESNDSSEAELPDDLPQTSSPSTTCRICGDSAWNRHFGVLSCNACAAFFRRSVAHRKSYRCRQGKNCCLQQHEARHLCRFCRFQRCIQAGMHIGAVVATSEDTPANASSLLRKLVLARRANFLNRFRATIQAYGGQQNMPKMANKHKDARSASFAIRAETKVLREFLASCGILSGHIPLICLQTLSRNIFYSWIVCESTLNTVKNAGFHTKRFYFVDESYVTINEDTLATYYLTDPNIKYPETCARHAFEYFAEIAALAAKFHSARLDESEEAALSLLLLVCTASKVMDDRDYFADQLGQIFSDLRKHYEENYDDMALRLGNIVLLLEEIQRVRHLFEEHLTMQKLSGKRLAVEAHKDNPLDLISTSKWP